MDQDTPNSKPSSINTNSSTPISIYSANPPKTPIISLLIHLLGEMVPHLPLILPELHERQQPLFRGMIGIAKVDFSMRLQRIWRRKVGLILRRAMKMIGCQRLMIETLSVKWWLWTLLPHAAVGRVAFVVCWSFWFEALSFIIWTSHHSWQTILQNLAHSDCDKFASYFESKNREISCNEFKPFSILQKKYEPVWVPSFISLPTIFWQLEVYGGNTESVSLHTELRLNYCYKEWNLFPFITLHMKIIIQHSVNGQ